MPDASTKAFELREFVPYLIARVGTLMEMSFTPDLKKAGITIDMWRVLMVLHFNGALTLIDLSRITGVKTPTLSRLVGRMIEKGLVSRRRSTGDTRTVQVALKDRGEALFQDLWPTGSGLQDLVIAELSASDVASLKRMLRDIEAKLIQHIENRGQIKKAG